MAGPFLCAFCKAKSSKKYIGCPCRTAHSVCFFAAASRRLCACGSVLLLSLLGGIVSGGKAAFSGQPSSSSVFSKPSAKCFKNQSNSSQSADSFLTDVRVVS